MGETKMRWDFFIFIFSLLAIMGTDTAFGKSRLGKFILEKILHDTSKNWPDHTDLLVFCLKFKLWPVCEYLNYCYNITNDCWAVPEKSKQRELRTYFFKKNPRSLRFVTSPLEIMDKRKLFLYPWKFCNIVLYPL